MNILAIALSLLIQDPIYSGPQPGEPVPSFKVLMMSGPAQGQEVTVECAVKPKVIVFIAKLERSAAQYIRLVDDYLADHSDSIDGLFVSLTADMNGMERHLPIVIKSINLKTPIGISVDGEEGPGGQGLNNKVMITTVAGKDGKAFFNQALVSPSGAVDFPRLAAELDKLPSPSLEALSKEELIARIRKLEKDLAELRKAKGAKPKGRDAKKADEMNDSMSGCSKEDEDMIRESARPIIRPEATKETIEGTLKKVAELVGEDEGRRKFWIGLIEIIQKQGYGNDTCKEALRSELARLKK